MTRPSLSAVFIVKNGAATLPEALASVAFCDEVIVVDSGSADRSREIARAAGAKVHERIFDDFASQKNHAVSVASGEWVLSVDADEVVTPELAAEIRSTIVPRQEDKSAGRPVAFRLRRRTYFLGHFLRFGGHQSDRPVRLFRGSAGRFEGRVHEEVRVSGGATGTLRAQLLHYSTRTAGEYFKKLNHYTDLEVRRMEEQAAPPKPLTIVFKPLARFAQKYFVQLGLADGWAGFVYAALSGYYEAVRQAKFWQKSKN